VTALRVIATALRRPEAALVAMVLTAYGYFYQAGGWNQNSRFDLTRAVVERGTLSIDAYHRNTGDKSRREGRYYCDKAPGVSMLAVPAYAAVRGLFGPGPGERPSPGFLAGAAQVSTVWAVGIPSALSVLALCLLLAALGVGLRARLALAAAYGLATLALPYSTLLYGHQLAGALTVIAFALLVRARRSGQPPGVALLFAAGALLGASVVVEYPSALAVAALTSYAAFTVRPVRRLAWLMAGGLGPALALAAYHAAAFGGPLTLPYEFSTQPHRSMGFFMGLGVPDPTALAHILVTPYRGLFFSAPWLLLAIPGAWFLWRRRGGAARAEAAVCIAIAVIFVWLNASLVDWEGGWTMGPRYLVPCLPFLVILVAGLALPTEPGAETPRRRLLVRAGWAMAAVAALYAAFLMLAGTAVKPEVPVVERRPLSRFILPQLARGQLSVSTQSIDSAGAPARGPRQAWNLGHLLGLDGLASLVPLGAAWIACGVWLVAGVRLRERTSSGTLDP
jgi:hypothetical protein